MLYSEVKNQILSLGFETASTFSDADYQAYLRDGINKALVFINVDFPLIGKYDISLDGTNDDLEEIDFTNETGFEFLIDAKIKKEVGGRMKLLPFADFEIVNNSLVYINANIEGDVTFFYRKSPTFVTTSTTDGTVITVDKKAEPLVALLASYYIWNDDDPEKAAKWKNEFEDMRNLIQARSVEHKPFTFTGGY
jgi:hypothetical protein